VTLLDGTQIVYGPCRRPCSIDELWAHILDVYTNGECRPRCGRGGIGGPQGYRSEVQGSNMTSRPTLNDAIAALARPLTEPDEAPGATFRAGSHTGQLGLRRSEAMSGGHEGKWPRIGPAAYTGRHQTRSRLPAWSPGWGG
jgi:hypothetical protein